jgi:hypothetical protein
MRLEGAAGQVNIAYAMSDMLSVAKYKKGPENEASRRLRRDNNLTVVTSRDQ